MFFILLQFMLLLVELLVLFPLPFWESLDCVSTGE